MGVHGLTTYLRENRGSLSKAVEFPTSLKDNDGAKTALVVDAWSFIYKTVADSGLSWVYGGEYHEFAEVVVTVVKAWISVGLTPLFIFDGPTPPKKFATVVSRLNQSHVQNGLLFFRTSSVSRSTRRFLNESRIIPPLMYDACVQALVTLKSKLEKTANGAEPPLQIYFADEEADSFAVELAGRSRGYIIGNDSDFVVLNCDGYEGYMPLDEVSWLGTETPAEDEEMDGWIVQRPKGKRKPVSRAVSVGKGIIPPENLDGVTLSLSIYTPQALAAKLDLPVSLLPLLGALVGNDYTLPASSSVTSHSPLATPRSSPPPTTKSFINLLFDRKSSPAQRISLVAKTLIQFIRPPSTTAKNRKAAGSVVELIDLTLNSLLQSNRAYASIVSSGEQSAMLEKVVEGTLPYAINAPPPEEDLNRLICHLHNPLDCSLYAVFDRSDLQNTQREEIATVYLRAYREGRFSPSLVDVVASGTYWPEVFLENPDIESVGRNLCRSIRLFGYALLEDGLGLPLREEEDEEGSEEAEENASIDNRTVDSLIEEDADEVIDVVESDSDEEDDTGSSLIEVEKLKGALRDLSFSDEDSNGIDDLIDVRGDMDTEDSVFESVPPSRERSTTRPTSKPKFVTEYVRKGSRVVGEDVEVPRLSQLELSTTIAAGPVQLQSRDERVSILLRFLESDTPTIRSINEQHLQPLLVVRYLVRQLHLRSVNTSKERAAEKWTAREAQAFLLATTSFDSIMANKDVELSPPEQVSERSVQLTAQVLMAIESIDHLCQILHVTDAVPPFSHHFSGRLFHALLAQVDPSSTLKVDEEIWAASSEGLGECFAEARGSKKGRKKNKSQVQKQRPALSNGRASLFGVLADMDDD